MKEMIEMQEKRSIKDETLCNTLKRTTLAEAYPLTWREDVRWLRCKRSKLSKRRVVARLQSE